MATEGKETTPHLPKMILTAVNKLENEIYMLDEWFQVQCGEEVPDVKGGSGSDERPPLVPLLQSLPTRLEGLAEFAAALRERLESGLTVGHGPAVPNAPAGELNLGPGKILNQ